MLHEHHKPVIWFRETNGAIHWRCSECDLVLPTTGHNYPGYQSAWSAAVAQPCSGVKDASLPTSWRTRVGRHQLGYDAHQGKLGWYRNHSSFVPLSYEALPSRDQDLAQNVGWNVLQSVLRDLIDWHTTQLSEGELCRRLGLDRLAWRDIRDQLGMTQIELPAEEEEVVYGLDD